ncbi:hypothetical protein BESB_016790 [Besnoitia besnoiti]|uniref:Uncharacterized protein n=1 Tax=Besnoitia besnoiti TaxID=94643 RepID=A0A2A9M7U6_BESBE|nr:hypothetical protein BESB_016790 [Besnoitia besnoiti]PFH32361.1 hypothetical protein BESB_016790 [Besnoitia besnoiti]
MRASGGRPGLGSRASSVAAEKRLGALQRRSRSSASMCAQDATSQSRRLPRARGGGFPSAPGSPSAGPGLQRTTFLLPFLRHTNRARGPAAAATRYVASRHKPHEWCFRGLTSALGVRAEPHRLAKVNLRTGRVAHLMRKALELTSSCVSARDTRYADCVASLMLSRDLASVCIAPDTVCHRVSLPPNASTPRGASNYCSACSVLTPALSACPVIHTVEPISKRLPFAACPRRPAAEARRTVAFLPRHARAPSVSDSFMPLQHRLRCDSLRRPRDAGGRAPGAATLSCVLPAGLRGSARFVSASAIRRPTNASPDSVLAPAAPQKRLESPTSSEDLLRSLADEAEWSANLTASLSWASSTSTSAASSVIWSSASRRSLSPKRDAGDAHAASPAARKAGGGPCPRQKRGARRRGKTPASASLFDVPLPRPERLPLDVTPYLTEASEARLERAAPTQTDALLPLPSEAPYQPAKRGIDASTQLCGNEELFRFAEEVAPLVHVIVSKTLEEAQTELAHEAELSAMAASRAAHLERQRRRREQEQHAERLERLRAENTQKLIAYHERRVEREKILIRKFTAVEAANQTSFNAMAAFALSRLQAGGAFIEDATVAVQTRTLGALNQRVADEVSQLALLTGVTMGLIHSALLTQVSLAESAQREYRKQERQRHAHARKVADIRRGRLHFTLRSEDIPCAAPENPADLTSHPPPQESYDEGESRSESDEEGESEESDDKAREPSAGEAQAESARRSSERHGGAAQVDRRDRGDAKPSASPACLPVPAEKRPGGARASTPRQRASASAQKRRSGQQGSDAAGPEDEDSRDSIARDARAEQEQREKRPGGKKQGATPSGRQPTRPGSAASPRRVSAPTENRDSAGEDGEQHRNETARPFAGERDSRSSAHSTTESMASSSTPPTPADSGDEVHAAYAEDRESDLDGKDNLDVDSDIIVGPLTVVKNSETRECLPMEDVRAAIAQWIRERIPKLAARAPDGFDVLKNGKVQTSVAALLLTSPGELFLKARPVNSQPHEESEEIAKEGERPVS